jgi:3-hydroxyisobutyrate dehydrogenase
LLSDGFPLSVFNRTAQKAKELGSKGARVVETPREAAAGADVIVSMVADDDASRSMWLGEGGALAGAKRGVVLVEASTLSTAWVAELAQAAARQGCDLLDTPVTGSKPQAAAGELLFLVGGSAEVLEKARPVLSVMSRGIVHVGPNGSGALLKLVNNFLCGIQAAALREALVLIEKGGLNQDKAFEVLTNGAPGSPLMKTLLSRLSTGVDPANFRLVLMTKDLAYGLKEAERRGIPVPMISAAHSLFTQAVKSGLGEKDFAAVAGPLQTER